MTPGTRLHAWDVEYQRLVTAEVLDVAGRELAVQRSDRETRTRLWLVSRSDGSVAEGLNLGATDYIRWYPTPAAAITARLRDLGDAERRIKVEQALLTAAWADAP